VSQFNPVPTLRSRFCTSYNLKSSVSWPQ